MVWFVPCDFLFSSSFIFLFIAVVFPSILFEYCIILMFFYAIWRCFGFSFVKKWAISASIIPNSTSDFICINRAIDNIRRMQQEDFDYFFFILSKWIQAIDIIHSFALSTLQSICNYHLTFRIIIFYLSRFSFANEQWAVVVQCWTIHK